MTGRTGGSTAADLALQLDLILRRIDDQQVEHDRLQAEIATARSLLENVRHEWDEIKPVRGCPWRGCGETSSYAQHDGAVYGRCQTHRTAFPSTKAAHDAHRAAVKQAEAARKATQEAKSLWPF